MMDPVTKINTYTRRIADRAMIAAKELARIADAMDALNAHDEWTDAQETEWTALCDARDNTLRSMPR